MIDLVDKEVNEALEKDLAVNEASTSRIYKRLSGEGTFAIISPYRGEYSRNENMARMLELKTDVRKLGYGFNQFISRWVEDGVSYDEQSLLIPNIKENEAIALGKKFEQSSIIFKDDTSCREICTTPFENYKDGEVVRTFYTKDNTLMNINEAKEIFSRRKGGPASMPIKGSNKKPFTLKANESLEVYEVIPARPSYFQSHPTIERII